MTCYQQAINGLKSYKPIIYPDINWYKKQICYGARDRDWRPEQQVGLFEKENRGFKKGVKHQHGHKKTNL
jgi:hypothetical protein